MNYKYLTFCDERCIINQKKVGVHMKPRIFVSSTFYDLKYVREDLSNFIRSHDFEPILFENGDIGYTPGEKLEKSCYDAMRNADMAVLIIGGNFGTESSEFVTIDNKGIEDYISITQQEFKTAVEDKVPMFVFIDSKVSGEYSIYLENEKKILKDPNHISFKATSDIRIFKFIKSIFDLRTISVCEFSRVSDIKEFLAKQWSDMFKKFLEHQKQLREIDSIKKSINKLENVVASMEIMMDAIGKNVLKESKEFENVKYKQRAQEIYNYLKQNIGAVFYEENLENAENYIKALKEIDQIYKSDKTIYECDDPGQPINTLDNIALETLSKYKISLDFWTVGIFGRLSEIIKDLNNDEICTYLKELIKKGANVRSVEFIVN